MTTYLREPFTVAGRWTGTFTIVAGRTGTGLRIVSNDTATWNFHSEGPHSEYVTCGFAFRTTTSTATRAVVSLVGGDGAEHIMLTVGTTGILSVRNGGVTATIRASSVAGVIVNDTWHFVEMQVRAHPLLGFAKVRVDGVEVINVADVDLRWDSGFTDIGIIRFGGSSSPYATQTFDDLYLAVGEGEPFKGDTPIAVVTEAHAVAQSLRVAFSDPLPVDWYRSFGQSLRVGFLPGTTSARVGHVSLRVLRKSDESPAEVSATRLYVLRGTGTPTASGTPTNVKMWNGSAFVAAPARTWSASWFQPSTAIKTWNGTAFVDAVGG
jgi:hypothetical protein